MINEDSIDESVGAHPTYVHYSELEAAKIERDLWQETAEAYKFTVQKLAEEMSQMKSNLVMADSTISALRKYVDLCLFFDEQYVCESCGEKGATYSRACHNPLHKIHDAIHDQE